jgi:hypothetical protein
MKRTFTPELRKRLAEATKARWAKQNDKAKTKTTGAAPGKQTPHIVNELDVPSLERRAGSAVAQRGRLYSKQSRRFKLQHLDEESASVEVLGDSGDYIVEFALVDEGDEVGITCECPYEDGEDSVICKHKIAAAYFLQAQYPTSTNQTASPNVASLAKSSLAVVTPAQPVTPPPPSPSRPWRQELNGLLMTDARGVTQKRTPALLFFSFIRRNHQYILQPGIVQAPAVSEALWHDREALQQFIYSQREHLFLNGWAQAMQTYQANSYEYVSCQCFVAVNSDWCKNC